MNCKFWLKKKPKKINLGTLLNKHGLGKIKISLLFINSEIHLGSADADAAWELYVEMLTRIVANPLPPEDGDEKTALDSIYSLFPTTRGILRRHGRNTIELSKIVIPVLNQVVRPFTAKWHKESLSESFQKEDKRKEFRNELRELQIQLRNYNHVLVEIADVEDLTDLEQINQVT